MLKLGLTTAALMGMGWSLCACSGGGPSPIMAIRRLSSVKLDAANSSIDQGAVLDLENSLDKSISVGEEFKVALESNAGTGYEWQCQLKDDPTILVDNPPEIAPVDTGVVGGRVRTIFVLHGISQGTVKIVFVLVRSWEKDVAPAKSLTLTLTVMPASAATK